MLKGGNNLPMRQLAHPACQAMQSIVGSFWSSEVSEAYTILSIARPSHSPRHTLSIKRCHNGTVL